MNQEKTTVRGSKARARILRVLRLSLILWIALALWPVAYTATRIALLALPLFCWMTALGLWWHQKVARWCLVLIAAIVVGSLIGPGRDVSQSQLRQRYLGELRNYEGTRYVWGGENRLGIDCSGLVRRALFQSLWKQGLMELNPSLLRLAFSLWWNDASARALADEYHGQTSRVFEAPMLSALSQNELMAGDLAVTSDGIHVMAFLGNGRYIEADPDVKRVILLRTSNTGDEANGWLSEPVTIVRWRVLEGVKDP